jgi:pyrimidine-nucleoside phosphorylase
MSKKIAAGTDAIVLDVKMGSGAFMRTLEDAEALAEAMVRIGQTVGRKVTALISDMNQPLGWAVGNALEVREAIATLHEGGPADLREHCLVVAGEMLYLGGKAANPEAGADLAAQTIASGAAWQKLKEMVDAQGGDVRYLDEPERLPQARIVAPVFAPRSGFLEEVQTDTIGMAVVGLGGGREKKGDPVDYAVGVVIHYKVGEWVEAGAPLFTVHANDEARQAEAARRVLAALAFSNDPVSPLPLFYRRIG